MKLRQAFAEYNLRYFDGLLHCSVGWSDKIYHRGWLGEYDPDSDHVSVSSKLIHMERVARMVLLHEMVHALINRQTGDVGHGPRFQKEMTRLADNGVFATLW